MSTKKRKSKLVKKSQARKNAPVKDWEWRMDPPNKSKGRFVTYERNQGEGYTPEVLMEAQKIITDRETAIRSAVKSAFQNDAVSPQNTKSPAPVECTETALQTAYNKLARTGETINSMIKHLTEIGDRNLGVLPLNKVEDKDSGWSGLGHEINKLIDKNADLLSTLDNMIYRLDKL